MTIIIGIPKNGKEIFYHSDKYCASVSCYLAPERREVIIFFNIPKTKLQRFKSLVLPKNEYFNIHHGSEKLCLIFGWMSSIQMDGHHPTDKLLLLLVIVSILVKTFLNKYIPNCLIKVPLIVIIISHNRFIYVDFKSGIKELSCTINYC